MASGCLSVPNEVAFPGMELFSGATYHTGRWPHEGVDFTGLRVAVIGTGSSAIQSIPNIARQASELWIFQRTPNYAVPAHNRELDEIYLREIKARYPELRAAQARSINNIAGRPPQGKAVERTPEEVEAELERRWEEGGLLFMGAFADMMLDRRSNEAAAEFVRKKIRQTVKDPATAELLCPHEHDRGQAALRRYRLFRDI